MNTMAQYMQGLFPGNKDAEVAWFLLMTNIDMLYVMRCGLKAQVVHTHGLIMFNREGFYFHCVNKIEW